MGAETDAANPDVVRLSRSAENPGIAQIVIDNPPVNAMSKAVRARLLEIVQIFARDESFAAAVVFGAGSVFVAGSDLREFEGPIGDPQLPVVVAALEQCPKPIVAAIRGVALGGGFELALGCDARIAEPNASVGLPEVTLGIIPGAGGAVKLPRMVDPAIALELVAIGRRVGAAEAFRLGLIDAIAEGDLLAAAERLASTAPKRRIRDEAPKPFDAARFEAEAAVLIRKARLRNATATKAAAAAIRRSIEEPYEQALAAERATFQQLRASEEAAALRHLFFSERRAGRVEAPAAAADPRRVAVVGAGTMGAGIAAVLLAADLPVTLIDADAAALQKGIARIEAVQTQAVASGRCAAADSAEKLARLTTATSLDAASEADLAIEAVFEDLALKREVFEKLDRIVPSGGILATNTSYLDIDAIAAATKRPESVLGLHFFSPVHLMRLVEVVRGDKTSAATLAFGVRLARRLNKLAVIARGGEGFIGNRVLAALREQCELLLDEGASPEDVDRALTQFGFAMGPFAVWDLAGLDIAWRARRQLAKPGASPDRPPSVLDELCRRGRFGRKTGAGWYAYGADGKTPGSDPLTHELVEAHARAVGRTRGALSDGEIVGRAMAAMVNAGALVFEEGVAASVDDVDLVMTNGYGFPAWRGGPMFWASRRPPGELAEALEKVAAVSGSAFRRADLKGSLACVGGAVTAKA